jgi:archaeosine-15-forming tRNA-guanine transglycosylase
MTLPPLPGHPEPHTYAWTKLELEAIEKYGQACADAAVAEKERLLQTARGALADIANSRDMTLATVRAKAKRVYGATYDGRRLHDAPISA